MLELIATASALAAEYLKTRKEDSDERTAERFRQWLESEVFPKLLAQSSEILSTVTALRATEHARYESIMENLAAIREAVEEPAAQRQWKFLNSDDRKLLGHLSSVASSEPLAVLSAEELVDALQLTPDDWHASAQYLGEQGLAEFHEYIGGWHVSPSVDGMLLFQEIEAPEGLKVAIARVANALPRRTETERIGHIAEVADVSLGLAYALVQRWAEQGLLGFEDHASPFEYSLVHHVSESLRRDLGLA